MADLGSDFACVDDITPTLEVVSGKLGVAQAVARRVLCPAGMLWYDRTYGYGVRRWLNSIDPPVASIASAIEAEALKDERVAACSVDVTFDSTERTMAVAFLVLTSSAESFDFTLNIAALTATLLLEGVVYRA